MDEVSRQVKAWGYTLRLIRDGEDARVVGSDERLTPVLRDVDIQVVVASPRTREQAIVFNEAQQVFTELHIAVHDLEDVAAVGTRAAQLIQGDELLWE